MEQALTKHWIIPKLQQILWFFLIFSLFFPIRYVLPSETANILGNYSDFTAFSLYLSDLIVISLFLLHIFANPFSTSKKWLILLPFWVLVSLLFNFSDSYPLSLYFFVRFTELLLLYWIVSEVNDNSFLKLGSVSFATLGGLQGLLATLQFLLQRSLGINLLGESPLGPAIEGVAKIVSHGTLYIRGYGTFPHSNVLSAFLVTALLISIYLIIVTKRRWERVIYSTLLAINVFGLFLTFSRAALIAGTIGLLILIPWLLLKHENKRRVLSVTLVLLITVAISFFALKDFIVTRATFSDNATQERVYYNQIAKEMIKSRALQGIGPGLSMLHMQQFTSVKLEPWQIQPIHNYFLLTAAELGIAGAILLLGFFLWHLAKIGKSLIWQKIDDENVHRLILAVILFTFLVLMLFDHYFYTIHQAQLLLWLILGLIMREIAIVKMKST